MRNNRIASVLDTVGRQMKWGGCGEICEEAFLGFSGTNVQAVDRME